ncbi:MAG TPA: undecaprenyldiphospho-muramoylpentapeptide beta-N-acetylglucosaminyltransferase [Clostridiaceae bacterium]|nr:undecaprenyldiphospho-muramoylpentapeptide beta-N-acetylglucosaminyltransferase [Clostridiaceae bacterium]
MKVIIAGGGTAGHINPGIAIAKQIRKEYPGSEILFIGTKRGMETKLVPYEGFEIKFIRVKGFRRKISLDTLIWLKELFLGICEARKIIKQFRPDTVIGTGGYVCGPVVFVASMMNIPTLIHEQNAFPGVTNRILSRFVDAVAISFRESERYFRSKEKLYYTGNPVRQEILKADKMSAREKLGIDMKKPLVVVVGGSLGAERINDTIVEMLKKRSGQYSFNMIFATGNGQYDRVMQLLQGVKTPNVDIVPYIYDAANVYAAADLIVCRAGAITCSELTALGVPAIMIPSPNVVANHQEYNARALEKNGAAVVILEKDLSEEILYNQIMRLLGDKKQLRKMAENSKKSGITNSAEKICWIIDKLVFGGK